MKTLTLKNGVMYEISVNASMNQYIIDFSDYISFFSATAVLTDDNLSEFSIKTNATGEIEIIKDKTVLSVSTISFDGKVRATFCIGNIDNTKKKLIEAEEEIVNLKTVIQQQQAQIDEQGSINEQQDLMVLELFESL